MYFSERYGYVKKVLQIEMMNENLKNRLWNVFADCWLVLRNKKLEETVYRLFISNFFKERKSIVAVIFFGDNELNELERKFNNLEWYRVYDFIEFFWMISKNNFEIIDEPYYRNFNDDRTMNPDEKEINEILESTYRWIPLSKKDMSKLESLADGFDFAIYIDSLEKFSFNKILEEELAGYRIINGKVTPIIDDIEIRTIEEALEQQEDAVKNHLSKALALLSNKEKPDYENSIKESICAVEALCKKLTNAPTITLGKALNEMKNKHKILQIPGEFYTVQEKLYQFANDTVRHAGNTERKDIADIKQEDAIYMLVVCSGFINYLKVKGLHRDYNQEEQE